LNIWFVQSAPRNFLGGGEIFAVRLASWLKSRGHSIKIVARPQSLTEQAAQAVWLDVRPLAMRNDVDWWSRHKLSRWFKADRPDVVFGAFARDIKLSGPGAREVGAPLYWLRGVPLDIASRGLARLDRDLVTGYIVPSAYLKAEIIRRTGFDADKLHVIHPALDPKPFMPDQAVADYGDRFRLGQAIPLSAPVAICPARLIEGKGQHVLLEAWAQVTRDHPDAYLLLAGDGPGRGALEAQARTLGLDSRVRFLGHLTDVRPALWISDIMILPTLSDSFPVAVLEAMASGLAVVASDVGGIPEQIEEGKSGLMSPPGDARALAQAIARVLSDGELRATLVRGGRERALQFTADRCFPALEALITRRPVAGAACV
jgi:glycosyltransferase involved in cell wall biosynthesis